MTRRQTGSEQGDATRVFRTGPLRIGLAALVLIGLGCSAERGVRRRTEPADSKPATLGSDFKEAPAGQTIPPAGIGVDMVRNPTTTRTNPLVETSFTRPSAPGQSTGF